MAEEVAKVVLARAGEVVIALVEGVREAAAVTVVVATTGVVGMLPAVATGVVRTVLELSCRDRNWYNPTRSWPVSVNLANTPSTTLKKTSGLRLILAKLMYAVLPTLGHFEPGSRFLPAYLRHFHTLQVSPALVALPP